MTFKWTRLLVSLVFFLTTSTESFATTPPSGQIPSQAEITKSTLMTLLEGPQNPQQVLLLAALQGADETALSAIHADFKKRKFVPGPSYLTLKNDQISFKDATTGILFTSYAPLNIEYKGQNWSYDKNKTIDQNYFTLMKILERKGTSGTASLWINSAQAKSKNFDETIAPVLGVMSGGMVGILVATACAMFLPGAVLLGIVGVGAVVGYALANNENNKQIAKESTMVDVILKSDFSLSCNSKGVVLSTIGSGNRSQIRIERNAPKNPIKVFDKNGSAISNDHFSPQQIQGLEALQLCQNEADAIRLTKQFKDAATAVSHVIAANEKPANPSQKPPAAVR